MTDHSEKPLLFLDIDGTLLPFRQEQGIKGTHADSYLARLDPQTVPGLTTLPCELVWATTWEGRANTELAPLISLAPLPVVNWPEPSKEDELEDRWFNLHWKTRTLVSWAAGRSFAWVDDEITDYDREWVAAHHDGSALLHQVDAARGLTASDLETLAAWLRRK
jgi:hypothetical protein